MIYIMCHCELGHFVTQINERHLSCKIIKKVVLWK